MTAASVGGHSRKGQHTVSVITVIHLNSGRKPSMLHPFAAAAARTSPDTACTETYVLFVALKDCHLQFRTAAGFIEQLPSSEFKVSNCMQKATI